MWKPEHRQAAERCGLRYPSDLTDAEWALVKPMIPPAKHGGRPRDVNIREVLNAICYVLSTGCQWQALPKDLPPKSTAHYYITSCCGTGTARWRASTTRSTSRPASRPDAKQARPRRSLTVRVPRPLKKGLCARPAGVRCRQEGHRTQAPHPRRYARPAVERDRSPCRRAGSRWCPPSAADGASSVSLHRVHLRGCRISGAEDGEGHCRYRVLDIADRQAQRCPPLRCLAQAMDRRAHNRMDQSQPSFGARLRTLRQDRCRLCPPRYDPHHAQTLDQTKPLLMNPNFLDRLLVLSLSLRSCLWNRARTMHRLFFSLNQCEISL